VVALLAVAQVQARAVVQAPMEIPQQDMVTEAGEQPQVLLETMAVEVRDPVVQS
jgi:hypothetical protein